MFENFNSDDINPMDYFSDIVDLLNYKDIPIDKIRIGGNDDLYLGNKEIKLDKYGNVMLCSGIISKIIGSIKIKSSVSLDGSLKNLSFEENIYSDGTPIELGDDVIVDDKYHARVDGFSDGQIVVKDQEEETFYVNPSQLKKISE